MNDTKKIPAYEVYPRESNEEKIIPAFTVFNREPKEEKIIPAFEMYPRITPGQSEIIQNLLKEANYRSLTNIKGYFNNNMWEIQGTDPTNATVIFSVISIGTGMQYFVSIYPKYQSYWELQFNCKKLYRFGYTQARIAEILGISQSYVSKILSRS